MPITSTEQLAGQLAVVTGSSGGIGQAIALELAAAGADVIVHARQSRDKAEATCESIRALGVESRVLLHDLSDLAGQDALVADAWNEQRPVDIWVNNAGADVLTGAPAKWSFEQRLEILLKVDVTATLRLGRAVGARMKQRGSGVILNMSWDRAEHGMAGESGEMFCAAKGAIAAFSRSLAKSLAPEVRVNCLAPGWIRTAWGEQASAYWQQRARRESLLDRWGETAEVARVARFLASSDASFVNGQVIQINGGFRSTDSDTD